MFRYYLLGGDTAAPSGLYARLCHAFLVLQLFRLDLGLGGVRNIWYVCLSARMLSEPHHQTLEEQSMTMT